MNRKRVYRLYCEEGLRIRRRRRKQVAAAPREKIAGPTRANERWSMDFMSDELEEGQPLRLLNIVDDFTRECPGIEVDRSCQPHHTDYPRGTSSRVIHYG